MYYVIGSKKLEVTDPLDPDWKSITLEDNVTPAERIENNDSLEWSDISIIGVLTSDSVRIIIKDSDSEVYDVSGWYFSVSDGLLGRTSMGSAVINRGKLKRPGETR